MDVITGRQEPGKSLPAELVVGGGSGMRRLMQNGSVVQQRGVRGVGDAASDAAAILTQTTQAALPLIVASNPGTYYQVNPVTGQMTLYAQPTGNAQNLALPYTYPGGGGTITTPLGSASLGGINSETMLLVGGLLLAWLMLGRR